MMLQLYRATVSFNIVVLAADEPEAREMVERHASTACGQAIELSLGPAPTEQVIMSLQPITTREDIPPGWADGNPFKPWWHSEEKSCAEIVADAMLASRGAGEEGK